MATCPRCKGHLTDNHKCPRRPAIVATEITIAAVAGAFAGLLFVAMFDQRGQMPDIDYAIAVMAGALAGVGLHRVFRR
jgi:hypothetical protein